MAIVDLETISIIIKNNPHKKLIENARIYSGKLMLHVLGKNLNNCLSRNEYFENEAVFNVRNKNTTSNKDLFERMLNREQMVFTAKGGTSFYKGLNQDQTQTLDARLDKIRFNLTIRKWVSEFALQAYRVDPMGVLYIEVDSNNLAYPTYKSTDCIYDYQPNGRKLEYVCFRLKASEAKQFLNDASLDTTNDDLNLKPDMYSPYFRFIDDEFDRIVKNTPTGIEELHSIPIQFDMLPAIRVSDVIDFTNPDNLLSPLDKTIELANTFLEDRSIRDLSKKFSGFPKAYEPILTCATCKGTGFLGAHACPDCTPAGSDRGTGVKLSTKVSDVARFPMPKEGQAGGIQDPSKFFGYITPNIETWNKQDTSLNDIEAAMSDTYWGTTDKQSTTGPTTTDKHAFKETATKTLNDLKPVYTRLNKTADWAESTENAICSFIGKQMFKSFISSSRTYGRYYILETPDELIEQYLDMKGKGAPQTSLFDALRKYYHSLYQDDPMQLAIKLKLIDVEPFVHKTIEQLQATNPSRIDFFMKMYFSEWLASKDDNYLLANATAQLITDLTTYASNKMVLPAELLTPPAVSESLTIRAQQ